MTTPLSNTPASTAAAATTIAAAPEMAKLRKAAQGFEAVFLRQMIASMRTASMGDGLFDSGASEQFRDMSDAQLAETMAGKGALGIADMLVRQWGARVAPQSTPAAADAKGAK